MGKFDSLNDTFNTDDGVEVDAIVKAENTELQKSQTRAENVEKIMIIQEVIYIH